MQNEWSHLLAELKAKRDGLTEVIATLEKHFSIPDANGDGNGSVVPAPALRRKYTRRSAPLKKAKAAKKNDRQTDRQSKERATRERSAEPP